LFAGADGVNRRMDGKRLPDPSRRNVDVVTVRHCGCDCLLCGWHGFKR
jgi:hypothetical protein